MTSATTSKSNATPTFPAVPQTSEARGSQPIPDVLYEDATKPPPRSPEPGDSTPSSPVPKVKRRFWKRRDYDQSDRWWFASTAIPLLAATIGPLANVSSIAALVSPWKTTIFINGGFVPQYDGVAIADPRWCYWINVGSLICGFLGNIFLLFNFTQRIRYLIALPATIIFWFISSALLISITVCMEVYLPPSRPDEIYAQSFWHAIAAASCYFTCCLILAINMLGYFLGRYPDTFALTEAQRTLILQTMIFFIWLAGGAAVFSAIERDAGEQDWAFSDALYFCDVTILTVGFGDLYPTTNLGRGLIMPYAVFGIIILGLVISSIYRFMRQLGTKNIVHKHMCRARDRTVSRAVSSSFDLRQREHQAHHLIRRRTLGVRGKPISSPFQPRAWSKKVVATTPLRLRPPLRQPKPIIMRQEKDRFDAMRAIQHRTREFSRWAAVCFSAFAYGVLWCVGAVVFWRCERNTQGMTYFEALYFCFISLLSIGYGDLAPESNAGRTFFVFWSLIAVPTMTILVSDMEDTFVSKFKKFSSDFADFTVLPRRGVWASFVKKRPWLLVWLKKEKAKKNVKRGFKTVDLDALEGREGEESRRQEEGGGGGGGEDADQAPDTHHGLPLNFHDLTSDTPTLPSAASLSLHLIRTLRYVSNDLRAPTPKQYSYEEWRYFTTLIRLAEDCTTTSTANPSHDPASEPTASESTENSAGSKEEGEEKKDAEQRDSAGVDWDWIGDDSPLLSGLGEPEWVSERLFKVLERLERVRARGEGGQVGAL